MATLASAPLPVGLIGLGKHGVRYLAHLRGDVPGRNIQVDDDADARQIFSELPGEARGDQYGVRAGCNAVPQCLPGVLHARVAGTAHPMIERQHDRLAVRTKNARCATLQTFHDDSRSSCER